MSSTRDPTNIVAASGLAAGSVFGMAGTFMANPNLQALSWGIDSSALVMAGALLAVKLARLRRDLVAAGFLVLAIASGVMLSGTASGPAASVPAFAAGAALWSVALLLISIPRHFAAPVRILGLISAVLFIITSARIFAGEPLVPTAAPLPFCAYPFLVITFIGWIWSLLRERT
jgi:hypothetical protein